jgi:hypothetical protein
MAVSERAKVRPVTAPERVTITVGVHGEEGADVHRGGSFAEDGALEPGSRALTVAEVGSFHEFGVPPFQLRSGAVHRASRKGLSSAPGSTRARSSSPRRSARR